MVTSTGIELKSILLGRDIIINRMDFDENFTSGIMYTSTKDVIKRNPTTNMLLGELLKRNSLSDTDAISAPRSSSSPCIMVSSSSIQKKTCPSSSTSSIARVDVKTSLSSSLRRRESYLTTIDEDILIEIVKYATAEDLVNLQFVHSRLYQTISSPRNSFIWHHALKCLLFSKRLEYNRSLPWRSKYAETSTLISGKPLKVATAHGGPKKSRAGHTTTLFYDRYLFILWGMSHLNSFPPGYSLMDLDTGFVADNENFDKYACSTTISVEPSPPSPPSRWLHSTCILKFSTVEVGCVFGGHDANGAFNDMYLIHLNPTKLTVSLEQIICSNTTNPQRRCGHTCHAVGTELLVFGGMGNVGEGSIFFNDLLLITLQVSGLGHNEQQKHYTWRTVRASGTPPCPRYCHSSAISKDQMFIFGGWDLESFYGDLHVYNRLSNTWSEVQTTGSIPRPCCQLASTHFTGSMTSGKGYLLLFGGCYRSNNHDPESVVFLDEFRILDLDLLIWLPIARTLPYYKGAVMASVASQKRGWILSGGMYNSQYGGRRFRNNLLLVQPNFSSVVPSLSYESFNIMPDPSDISNASLEDTNF